MQQDRLLGVISDTHGLIRPQALAALRGCDSIIHAGDIGNAEVIARLAEIAPVAAIRGNVDKGAWAATLPGTEIVEVGQLLIYVLHNIADLELDPPTVGFAAVIFGHSHRPSLETREGVLYLNPGAAGPRRFGLPVTIARVRISGRDLHTEIVELEV